MIGLMYIQPSKQSEMDKVFQNGIFRYIGLMIGLMCIQPLHAESLVTKRQYLSCSMSHSGRGSAIKIVQKKFCSKCHF